MSTVYMLTNLEFVGPERSTYTDGSWAFDRLTFVYRDVQCALHHVPDYGDIIKELSETHGAAITATLRLKHDQPLDVQWCDNFANAVCELLSFATKNTVHWVSREILGIEAQPVYCRGSLFGRARDFRSGWSIISDFVHVDHIRRPELKLFLSAVIESYVDRLKGKLETALLWINEAGHENFVDLSFICLFIGIEKLRGQVLPKSSTSYLCDDWQELLDNALALDILAVVEKRLGSLSQDQAKLLISKIRSVNSPPTIVLLEELCASLGVLGLDKDIGLLRNKLFHAGSYGNFEFSKVVELRKNLSHVVDVCVLKVLGYDGYYRHEATAWRAVKL